MTSWRSSQTIANSQEADQVLQTVPRVLRAQCTKYAALVPPPVSVVLPDGRMATIASSCRSGRGKERRHVAASSQLPLLEGRV